MKMDDLLANIKADADRCVQCGFCLPHCPTYTLTQHEAESPRGRISLMKAWAADQLPLSAKLEQYLNHCLVCRACENVCPSGVAYGKLITTTRQAINMQQPRPLSRLATLLTHPRRARILQAFAALAQWIGLTRLATRILRAGTLKRAAEISRVRWPKHFADFYPARAKLHGNIALFAACADRFFDQENITATIELLTLGGYAVYIPKLLRCCGALHTHAGLTNPFAEDNHTILKQKNFTAVLHSSSACALQLQTQNLPALELNAFLLRLIQKPSITLRPLPANILIHTPCTLPDNTAQIALLKCIPSVNVITFASHQCCGAAGNYMLEYPEMSKQLGEQLLNTLTCQPDYFITANIGCQLHLTQLLRKRYPQIKVVSIATLLWQQRVSSAHR